MNDALRRLLEGLRGPRSDPDREVLLRGAPVERREIGDIHDMLLFRSGMPQRD